jgi:hypothetical protein
MTPSTPDAPASGPTGGGGAAGDLASAVNRILNEARSGGLKSKTRAGLVLGEGLKVLGSALHEYARHLQEAGKYPAFAWEPVRKSATMATSAGSTMAEHGSAMQEIAGTPMGEAQGKAPDREELNKG